MLKFGYEKVTHVFLGEAELQQQQKNFKKNICWIRFLTIIFTFFIFSLQFHYYVIIIRV